MHKRTVSPDAFVLAWQRSTSLTQAAKRLGMTEHAAEVRAYRYRAQGVRLKDLRNAKRLDIDALNRLIAESP